MSERQLFRNNISIALASSVVDSDTELDLATGLGALIGTIDTDQFIRGLVKDDNGDYEIVKITGISGDTVTVERAEENTTALNFDLADNPVLSLRLTKDTMERFPQKAADETIAGLWTFAQVPAGANDLGERSKLTSLDTGDLISVYDASAAAAKEITEANLRAAMSYPPQTYFRANRETTQSIADNTFTRVAYNNELVDEGSNYATSGVFTAPADGYYLFTFAAEFTNSANLEAGEQVILRLNTSGGNYEVFRSRMPATNVRQAMSGSVLVKMTAGQTAEVEIYQNSGSSIQVNASSSNNWFTGARVG